MPRREPAYNRKSLLYFYLKPTFFFLLSISHFYKFYYIFFFRFYGIIFLIFLQCLPIILHVCPLSSPSLFQALLSYIPRVPLHLLLGPLIPTLFQVIIFTFRKIHLFATSYRICQLTGHNSIWVSFDCNSNPSCSPWDSGV